jgi:hypothetical protein
MGDPRLPGKAKDVIGNLLNPKGKGVSESGSVNLAHI